MALVKCSECGHMISDKAIRCPKCGTPLKKVESIESQGTSTEKTVRNKKNRVNGLMIAFCAIVVISIMAFFWWQDNKGNEHDYTIAASDTKYDVQDVDSVPTENHVEKTEIERVDTLVIESAEETEKMEDAFFTNNDVMAFVCGNRYTHDDITIVITEEGIYANDNKLGDNPRFRRLSKNKGTIKTSEISITVNREDNTLIDNKSGDIYYKYYY